MHKEQGEPLLFIPEAIQDIKEQVAYLLRNYMPKLEEFVTREKKKKSGDFFVRIDMRHDPINNKPLPVIRRCLACPTPITSQTVWHYHADAGDLEHLWTIPSPDIIVAVKDNPLEIDPDLKDLRDNAMNYIDGTYDKLAKKLNKEDEKPSTVALKYKEIKV